MTSLTKGCETHEQSDDFGGFERSSGLSDGGLRRHPRRSADGVLPPAAVAGSHLRRTAGERERTKRLERAHGPPGGR